MTGAERYLLMRNADTHLRGIAAVIAALSRDPQSNEQALDVLRTKLERLAVRTFPMQLVGTEH